MIKYYSINGKVVPVEQAMIRVNDLGFLRGYSVFDFFRIYKGVPLFVEDHLDRFEKSAAGLGLIIPFSREILTNKILEIVRVNKLKYGGIKLVLTGGYSQDGFLPTEPNLVILASSLTTFPESYYTKGVKLMSYQYTRETPYTKTTNYLIPISIQQEIEMAEAFDVIYHDGTNISESARSNFFIVDQKGIIITPERDALQGITRKRVQELSQKHYEVVIRPLKLKETMQAKEAFMTSSTKKIMPVRQIDFWRINEGMIGPTTRHLMQLFEQHVEDYVSEASQKGKFN